MPLRGLTPPSAQPIETPAVDGTDGDAIMRQSAS